MDLLMETTLNYEREHVQQVTRQKMLAVASHELRNPLQALSFLTCYLNSFQFNAIQREILNDIRQTLEILNSIIENVLDYAKIDANKMILSEKSFSILDSVERVVSMFFGKAREKGITIYSVVDTSIPHELLGDSVKITQVLSNLAGNAIKFTKEGYVLLRATLESLDEDKCIISLHIEDTGIGMTADHLAALYKPFEQLHDSEIVEQRGWGLGLSITRHLVGILNGHMVIESEYGKFTLVKISLRLKPVGKELIRDKIMKINDGSQIHVTILHPNDLMCECLKRYLHDMGIDDIDSKLVHREIPREKNALILHESLLEQFRS